MKLTLEHTATLSVNLSEAALMLETIQRSSYRCIRIGAAELLAKLAKDIAEELAKDQDKPEPVVDTLAQYQTRDGREVIGLRHTGDDKWCIHGYVGGCKISWMANGRWSAFDTEHALDLIPTGEVGP